MALGPWLLLAAAVAFFLWQNHRPRRAQRGEKLPPLVAGSWFPFFGAIVKFGKEPMRTVMQCSEQFGDIFTLKIVGRHMTFLTSKEAHKAFFDATDDIVSAKEAYRFVVPVFGRGVVYDSPTHVMYEQLKFVRGGLGVPALRRSVPLILEQTKSYLSEKFDQTGGQTEILDTLNEVTILTASRCLLGKEINEEPEVASKFAKLYHDLEQGLQPISFFFPYLPIPAHRRRDAARIEVSKLFRSVLNKRRAGEKQDDMMQNLLDAVYKSGDKMTDDQIAGLSVGILFAGQHTSGITSTWTLLHLLDNPQYMEKVLREQQDILAEFGDEISYDSVRKSKYLEQCVRETLRLLPPLIHLMRKVMKPMSYNGYTIPVGDLVCISPGATMRLERTYKDGETWNPERMEASQLLEDVRSYRYIPFGGGRHGCPGEAFGITQIKTVLTHMLRTYDFELIGKLPPADYEVMVVGPKQPYSIKYKPRATPIDQLNL